MEENKKTEDDYKKRAKELLAWINNKEKELDNPEILDFGQNIKECEDSEDKFHDYKKGEKQDKIKEKNDLEVMLINLKSKQRAEELEVFEVPDDLSGPKIGEEWNNLQKSEEKYDEALQAAIKRMKDLEKDLNRFNSLADKVISWNNDKDKFLKEEIKSTDELPVIRAKVNVMKSFANELKSVKSSADKANDVGKKVIEGHHSASKDVESKIQKMKELFELTEKLEKDKLEKLDHSVKFLEEMEAKSVELASKTDKLNSIFSIANSHLSEPINCNSSKDAEELEHEVDEIKKKNMIVNQKKSLEEIEALEKGIKEKGGDPSQYSNISASGLKKKKIR